jgi:hypothetical protein
LLAVVSKYENDAWTFPSVKKISPKTI